MTPTFFRTDNGERKVAVLGKGDVPSFLLNLGLMETCIEIMNEERTLAPALKLPELSGNCAAYPNA